MQTYTGKIAQTERMRSSKNGNPRVRVVFTDGQSAATGVDAQIGYAIENSEYKEFEHVFELNMRGEIIRARRVDA